MKRLRAGKCKAKAFMFAALAASFFIPAFSPVAAFAALEKSSKKECALCHVMWLDVFRTNKETLIQWQPGNVLMKNTQGIVSSEEVCYSCHDGYVADARYTVWDYHNHPVFKKPSTDIKIPAALTLSNKDEIYCGTCHSPHSGRTAAPGSSPEETMPGPLSFLKLPNVDSGLCEACHVNEADFKRTNGHPMQADKLKLPEALFAQGSVRAEKKNVMICQTCHVVHGAKGRNITVMSDSRSSALCVECHRDKGTIAGSPHDVRKSMPEETNLLGQSASESGPCGACHVPHNSAGYKLWARKSQPGNPASWTCLTCHSGASARLGNPDGLNNEINKIAGIGRYSHPLDISAIPKAGGKVSATPGTIHLPVYSQGGIQKPEGTMQCFTCHAVHQWDPNNPDDRGGKDVAGDASNSFLRMTSNRSSALCVECHRDKRTIAGTLHDARESMPEETNRLGQSASQSGPCGACHVPHNSAGYKLWGRKEQPGNPASWTCLTCHNGAPETPGRPNSPSNAMNKIKGIGRYSHPLDISAVPKDGGKVSATPGAINLPVYSQGGIQKPEGTMQCATCHAVHQWDPSNPDDRGGKNVAGDASNSFLRMSTSHSSALCVDCHQDKQSILSFDHNLVLTAPEAKNIRGDIAVVSGPCGACHLPHNAVDKRLWARAVFWSKGAAPHYCIDCHGPNGAAKEKQVGKNDHPVDVVLKGTDIPAPARISALLPLYNAEGGAQGADRIMCSTCHDPHIWSANDQAIAPSRAPETRTHAAVQNIEGDARNSFLRRVASPTPDLCVVCHEDTALLAGTDHDFFITAPTDKNLLGETVIEAGQCGVCHAVHNSPPGSLLWAQAYGPVEENQHPMNALCTGCHSKAGVAKNKIPAVATHPKGELIDNIFTFNNQYKGYIKIFDDHWKEVQVGDLSCSSCHSFYQWDHRIRKAGPGRNVEGNADTSFLRTSSDKTVCIDCHENAAIWRYLYFHSVPKRAMLKGVWP